MGVIDDIRKWLKEFPLWQELEKIPGRVDQLETRVATLEKALEASPAKPAPNADSIPGKAIISAIIISCFITPPAWPNLS